MWEVFYRRRVNSGEEESQGLIFDPVNFPTVDAFAYAPVIAGMWQQHEVFDGTYDFDDLLDAHEILAVKAINAERLRDALERKNR